MNKGRAQPARSTQTMSLSPILGRALTSTTSGVILLSHSMTFVTCCWLVGRALCPELLRTTTPTGLHYFVFDRRLGRKRQSDRATTGWRDDGRERGYMISCPLTLPRLENRSTSYSQYFCTIPLFHGFRPPKTEKCVRKAGRHVLLVLILFQRKIESKRKVCF